MARNGAVPRCECACGCRAKLDAYGTPEALRKPLCSSCAAGACVAADLRETEKALRQACLPLVADIVVGLKKQGMSHKKACQTVRWATYMFEGVQTDNSTEE